MAKTNLTMRKNFFAALDEKEIMLTEVFVKDMIDKMQQDYSALPPAGAILGLFALIHCHPIGKQQKLSIGDMFTDWLAFSKAHNALDARDL